MTRTDDLDLSWHVELLPPDGIVNDDIRMSNEWAALIGVALGGTFAIGGTSLQQRAARKEHRLTRWDEARLSAYFEFGAAVKSEIRTCDRIAAWRGYRDGAAPLNPEVGRERLAAEADTRTTLLEQVRLVASKSTTTAAQELQEAAWKLHKAVLSSDDGAQELYLDVFKNLASVRDRFYEVARIELHVGTD